jgi:hypothetical protein
LQKPITGRIALPRIVLRDEGNAVLIWLRTLKITERTGLK